MSADPVQKGRWAPSGGSQGRKLGTGYGNFGHSTLGRDCSNHHHSGTQETGHWIWEFRAQDTGQRLPKPSPFRHPGNWALDTRFWALGREVVSKLSPPRQLMTLHPRYTHCSPLPHKYRERLIFKYFFKYA